MNHLGLELHLDRLRSQQVQDQEHVLFLLDVLCSPQKDSSLVLLDDVSRQILVVETLLHSADSVLLHVSQPFTPAFFSQFLQSQVEVVLLKQSQRLGDGDETATGRGLGGR